MVYKPLVQSTRDITNTLILLNKGGFGVKETKRVRTIHSLSV